ncbi:MAG TPA: hypothetical protein DD727_06585 [Clostridiales bacterium]|nr:hypothetical protein [Clostridiales bacterium]
MKEVAAKITHPSAGENSLYEILNGACYACSLFDTYLLFESRDFLILIDQHAAHERILFEELRQRLAHEDDPDQPHPAQLLLDGDVLEVGSALEKTAFDHIQILQHAGFDFTRFGPGTLRLNQIPALGQSYDHRVVFSSLLDNLQQDQEQSAAFASLISGNMEKLYKTACKAAVKANQPLKEHEVETLIKRLNGMENPYTCPHGRPVLLKMTKRDLEKLFKRIL